MSAPLLISRSPNLITISIEDQLSEILTNPTEMDKGSKQIETSSDFIYL